MNVTFICTISAVRADEVAKEASHTPFSLEELMLLADAAEKAKKNGNEDDSENTSNFQHRYI